MAESASESGPAVSSSLQTSSEDTAEGSPALRVGVSLGLLALAAYGLVAALEFPTDAQWGPFVVGTPLTLAVAAVCVRECVTLYRSRRRSDQRLGRGRSGAERLGEFEAGPVDAPGPAMGEGAEVPSRVARPAATEARDRGRTVLSSFAWLGLYGVLLVYTGTLISAGIFAVVFMVARREKWYIALLVAALLVGFLYVAFLELLAIQLYPGRLDLL